MVIMQSSQPLPEMIDSEFERVQYCCISGKDYEARYISSIFEASVSFKQEQLDFPPLKQKDFWRRKVTIKEEFSPDITLYLYTKPESSTTT